MPGDVVGPCGNEVVASLDLLERRRLPNSDFAMWVPLESHELPAAVLGQRQPRGQRVAREHVWHVWHSVLHTLFRPAVTTAVHAR